LSRAGRLLAVVALGAAACARPAITLPGAPRLADEPWINVGIVVDRDTAELSATGQFRVLDSTGGILAVQDADAQWRAEPGEERRVRLIRPDRAVPTAVAAPLTLRPERETDLVTINGRRYRGEVVIQRGSTGITIVNRVPLEAYLRSVVALELGFRGEGDRQAVMSQAVAARTYALRFRGRRVALGFDVFPTDADQVYNGVEAERPEITDAVTRTAGQILTWEGRPIQALFHSTCGWSTESADQVFSGGERVPYLRAVSDRYGRGSRDFYCAISPRFRWREEWDAQTLRAILSRTGADPAAVGRITSIAASGTTPTGRLTELVVTTDQGRLAIPRGRIREVLRPAPDRQLLSTLLQLHVQREGDSVSRVVAAGAGYGHGVGMCQFGAVGRSRSGQHYQDILATYYPGTRLTRLY
jgi:stage II sporulation protein D